MMHKLLILCLHIENITEVQITLNGYSDNITGRMFAYNFGRTLQENVPKCRRKLVICIELLSTKT